MSDKHWMDEIDELEELERLELEEKAHKMWKALHTRMYRATKEQRALGHALFLDIALDMDIEVREQTDGESRSKVVYDALVQLPVATIINFLDKCHEALNKEGISLREKSATKQRAVRSVRDDEPPMRGKDDEERTSESGPSARGPNGHAHHENSDISGRRQKPRYRPDEAVLEGEQPNKHSEKRAQSEDPAAGQRKEDDKPPRKLDDVLDPMRRPWGLTRGNDLPQ